MHTAHMFAPNKRTMAPPARSWPPWVSLVPPLRRCAPGPNTPLQVFCAVQRRTATLPLPLNLATRQLLVIPSLDPNAVQRRTATLPLPLNLATRQLLEIPSLDPNAVQRRTATLPPPLSLVTRKLVMVPCFLTPNHACRVSLSQRDALTTSTRSELVAQQATWRVLDNTLQSDPPRYSCGVSMSQRDALTTSTRSEPGCDLPGQQRY